MAAVPCKALNDVGFDNSLWYTISVHNNDKLLVGVLYRAPSSSIENNQRLLSIISSVRETVSFSHLLIMGDFNFPSIDWPQLECTTRDNSAVSLFLDAVQDSFLTDDLINEVWVRRENQVK